MQQRFIIPSILILISLYWLWAAFALYGIWSDEGPEGGFMPAVASVLTILFSISSIFKSKSENKKMYQTIFIPVGIIIAFLLLVPYVGMIPLILLMLIGWFKFLEHYPWRFTLITSGCVTFAVWLIFEFWLRVPFPKGFWG